MRKSVLLRADGSETMGLGHLYRMVALADMLAPDFDCYLAYREGFSAVWTDNENICASYKITGPEEEEAAEVCALATGLQEESGYPVIIVLDGYKFDLNYQACIKAEGFQLVFVDDIQHTAFVCDLVVNHAPSARRIDYELAHYSKTAFGLRFALLRQVFLLPSEQVLSSDPKASVFLCLGGADPDNLSVSVLKLLEDSGFDCLVNLVIGSAYLHKEALAAFLAQSKLSVRVHQGLSAQEMSALMWSSAFGITSPSTISLEYLATGKQLYLQQTADNQKDIQAALLSQKIAYPLDALKRVDKYPLNSAVGRLYDGNQGIRFRKLFSGLGLNIRGARYDDCKLIYRWATDPAVRAQSFSSEEIHWHKHRAWFIGQLARADRRFYICENEEGPIGLVRFSIENEVALLGYSLGTSARGKGYGVSMLHFATERLRAELPSVVKIDAYVKKENIASQITLARLGYAEFPTEAHRDALKFILDIAELKHFE